MLKFENISFSYDTKEFIKDFNLEIIKDDFLIILGKNGSGKSTLLKLILGVERPISGKIFLRDLDIFSDIYEARKKIGYVFQNPDEQIVSHTVETEIAFSMENYGYSSEEMKLKIDDLLKLVNLNEKKSVLIEELSGGEKQRLCIASALALDPEVLILDEPTSMLDSKNRNIIMELLKEINSKGTTIIVVSHHLKELKYCKSILYIKNADKLFYGSKEKFIEKVGEDVWNSL